MKNICVFCGSSKGRDPLFAEAVEPLAEALTRRRIGLVYGGAKIGLMGLLADAVLKRGGRVTGVIVTSLAGREIAHEGLSELHVVETMHERKAKMYSLAEGFIAFPGGLGTLDEFFEIVTWAVLGYHTKPCGILNVRNYFDRLLEFLDFSTAEGFIKMKHREKIYVTEKPDALLELFIAHPGSGRTEVPA